MNIYILLNYLIASKRKVENSIQLCIINLLKAFEAEDHIIKFQPPDGCYIEVSIIRYISLV